MPDTLALIKQAVGSALSSAGMTKAATLIRVTPGTRTVGQPSAGTNPTTTSVTCQGLVKSTTKEKIGGTLVEKTDRVVMLFGSSLGDVAPATKDRITIEGLTQNVVGVDRDPAGAVFECLCRS
ncbi:MAG: hypothetical protein EHM89_00135 [Acidobacteria bacterium]|nr:MAG: hypothetical protein EHM89_00135 [Acidobacteriota bacterium]